MTSQPRKPAFLTVRKDRMRRYMNDGIDAWKQFWKDNGITGMTIIYDDREFDGIFGHRVTFIDDYAAAEFALRYA